MRQVKSINYADIDLKVANDVKFYFDYDRNAISDGENLTILSEQANMPLGPLTPFPIQFAPKITGDNKTGNYTAPPELSQTVLFYSEPKLWNGASDRKLNFKLTYIADGGKWSYKAIKNIAHFSKSLFYMNKLAALKSGREINSIIRAPVLVIEKMYGIIETQSTWALNTVDVTHGEKIIEHEDGLFGPIKTEISFSCSEWTRMQDQGRALDANMAIANLVDKPTVLWY